MPPGIGGGRSTMPHPPRQSGESLRRMCRRHRRKRRFSRRAIPARSRRCRPGRARRPHRALRPRLRAFPDGIACASRRARRPTRPIARAGGPGEQAIPGVRRGESSRRRRRSDAEPVFAAPHEPAAAGRADDRMTCADGGGAADRGVSNPVPPRLSGSERGGRGAQSSNRLRQSHHVPSTAAIGRETEAPLGFSRRLVAEGALAGDSPFIRD